MLAAPIVDSRVAGTASRGTVKRWLGPMAERGNSATATPTDTVVVLVVVVLLQTLQVVASHIACCRLVVLLLLLLVLGMPGAGGAPVIPQ